MQLDGIHHIGVNVQNLERSEKFYIEILGFQVIERYAEKFQHLILDTGGAKLHLFENPALEMHEALARPSEQGYAHVAFGTCRKDFPIIIEELKINNIEFRGPLLLGKGESIHFKDPDGNNLEIRCPAK